MMRENGPQRAARRAQRNGLTVGGSVRDAARVHWGLGAPPPNAGLRSERRYGGAAATTPLDFAQRLERYAGQACALYGGVFLGWRPTARQRRRLSAKANHAAAPFGRRDPSHVTNLARAEALRPLVEAGHVVHPDDGLDAARYAVRGFRVVDRRGEHAA